MARGSVDVRASIERHRLVPNSRASRAINEYLYPIILLAGGGLIFSRNTYVRSQFLLFEPFAIFVFLLLVVLPSYWFYANYRSYRLVRIGVHGSQEELLQRALDAVDEIGWSVREEEDDFVVAYSRAGFTAGQAITIIVQPNALYVNSQTRSSRRGRSPFSFGSDEENIRMLRAALAPEGSFGQPLEP